MSCRKIRKLIESGEGSDNSFIKEHVSLCKKCSDYFEAYLITRKLFKQYDPAMDDPDGEQFNDLFAAKLDSVQNIDIRTKERSFFRPAFSFSILAIVVMSVALFLLTTQTTEDLEKYEYDEAVPEQELFSVYSTSAGEPVGIIIEYESPQSISEVTVEFQLDRGVQFHSEDESLKDLEKFVWKGSFKEGSNKIPFVVNIVESGKWEIMTVAEFNGYSHRHRITLDASEDVALVKIFKYVPEKIREKI